MRLIVVVRLGAVVALPFMRLDREVKRRGEGVDRRE